MTTRHWASLGETTFVGGTWCLYAIYRWLGRWPFRICTAPVVLVWWLGSGVARRASLDYLRRLHDAHAVFARRPGALQSLRHFFRFAETLLDKLLAVGGRAGQLPVTMSGHEPMLAQARAGQGAVIATAHMGCLELMQMAAGWRAGLRVTVLVHTAHAPRFNAMLARINPAATVQLLQVAEFSPATALLLAERIGRGEFVAIAGDRVPVRSDRRCTASFLGAPAQFPAGPYLLASVLRCPLWLLSCLHDDDGGYRARLELLAQRVELPRQHRQQALDAHAARFADWLTGCLRQSPYDWFNFYPFWERADHARDLA